VIRRFASLCVVSGAHVDATGKLDAPPAFGFSNPGRMRRAPGGAGLNAASAAAALGLKVTLAGAIGDDADGQLIRATLATRGIGDALAPLPGHATGQYIAIVGPDGQMAIGFADLAIHEAADAAFLLAHCGKALTAAEAWLVSPNLTQASLVELAGRAQHRLLAAATISPAKAVRLTPILARLDLLFANLAEARALTRLANASPKALIEALVSAGVKAAVLSDSGNPLHGYCAAGSFALQPPRLAAIADVNGAGDALAGATLACLARGMALADAAATGIAAAQATLANAEPFAAGLGFATLAKAAANIRRIA
jgi:sugar/nucleoside kinase (ribokinase family)